MSVLSDFSDHVRSFLLQGGASDRLRYEHPARGNDGRALAVALPRTVDDVRALVRESSVHHMRLLPQGANSGLVGASVPTADGDIIVVSTAHLLIDVPRNGADAQRCVVFPDERLAVVSAGLRLSELNAAAAAYGLQLPVDLSADPMIGGMIATNTGGSRVVHYGAMKNHVVSVQAIAADKHASIMGSLDRLHKDSRGLDIAQLLIGSGGTLGIIVAAVIALSPLPKYQQTWWLALDDVTNASSVFTRLYAMRPNELSAFEFVSSNALSRTLGLDGAPANPFRDYIPAGVLLVEWSALHESLLFHIERDIASVADVGLINDGVRVDSVSAWGIRHRVSESLRHYGVVLGHDISVPLDVVMQTRAHAIEAVHRIAADAVVCDFGHLGDGGLHLNVLLPTDDARIENLRIENLRIENLRIEMRRAIDEIVVRVGGSYSAEHGLGPLNATRWKMATPQIEQELIRSLKRVVDPNHLLGHPLHPYNQLSDIQLSDNQLSD